MKKTIVLLLILSMLLSLAACGGTKDGAKQDGSADKEEKPSVLSPEKTSTEVGGVKVDVGSFVLDGEAELSVAQLSEEADEDAGWKVEPYEISVGDLHELDDYITVRIPYDGTEFCDAGEDPAKCVGAKYKNPETGDWEDVLFSVDEAAKELVIYTDHLSVFGAFYVKNEGMRKAYITDVLKDVDAISYEQAVGAMQSYVSAGGDETPELIKAGTAVLGSMTELASVYGDLSDGAENIINLVTLGTEQFDEILPEQAGELLGTVGTFASILKVAKNVLSDEKSDKLDLYKDAVSMMIEGGGEALTAAGGAAFGVALSGVWVFDKIIGKMFEEAEATKLEQIGEVYEYYNDKYSGGGYHARTLKEWRQLMIDITAASPEDPDAVREAIDAEIDKYCRAFWNIGGDTLAEVEDDAGFKRMPFPTQDEMDRLTEQYKQNLYERLYPVTTSVRNYFENNAKAEYLKSLNKLKAFYNQRVSFTAKEEIEAGAESVYAGYTAKFGDLGKGALEANWVDKVSDKGEVRTSFTLLGYLMAGEPKELRLYAPGDDPQTASPELVVPIKVSVPAIEVTFGGAPKLEDLLGEYNGSVELLSFKISDAGYELYTSSEEGGDTMSKAECDEALSEMVAEGELAMVQSVKVSSDDPSSGKCTLTLFLADEDEPAPVSVEASYAGGVLTAACADGSTASVTVKEEDGTYTLAGENIVTGASDPEFGDMVLYYIGASFEVTK